jgi:hypothetical protein
MPSHARKMIEERFYSRERSTALLGLFDKVWGRSPVKDAAVADAIAEAICVLSDAGQQSLSELERYATYRARLAIGLPAAN